MSNLLDDILERIEGMSPARLAEVERLAIEGTQGMKWIPSPGPQSDAYFSKADVLLYGGQGGGGKSDLLLGLALTAHKRSLIMRRQYTDLAAITDRAKEIHGTSKGFSGSPPPKLRTDDGRLIDFGAAKDVGDEQHWQGQAHDLLGLDEAVHFAESQVRFLMGWVRSTSPGQGTRVVFATNPPLAEQGDWIIAMFAPWLDPTYPDPAEPGELRWVITDHEGNDKWVDGPGEYLVYDMDGNPVMHEGEQRTVRAMSRTFIPSSVHDNPYLKNTDYVAQLDALPEPLRSAVRDGQFGKVRQDHELQLIPYEWVRAAQERWKPSPPSDAPMCSIGVDVASGGPDQTVLARRHDFWFDELLTEPGVKTPLGTDVAALVIKHRRDSAQVIVDCGGGYGNGPAEHLEINGVPVTRYLGAAETMGRTLQGKIKFANKRTEVYYRLYEALDPSQPGGSNISLPPDPELTSDLCAIRLESDDLKIIRLESKKNLVKRLGRSTDKGDAVAMAWSDGPKRATHHRIWKAYTKPSKSVNMGRVAARRR